MRVGLHVRDVESRAVAIVILDVGWQAIPWPGASWSCCRRRGAAVCTVESVEWCGLPGECDLWIRLSAGSRMVGHLVAQHKFMADMEH